MRAVVDTNVMAYFLLGAEPFVDEARRFWEAVREPITPALWEAELANVVWMAIRGGILEARDGPKRLELAARLGVHSAPGRKLWHGGGHSRRTVGDSRLRHPIRRACRPRTASPGNLR